MNSLQNIEKLIQQNALFIVNHSGGKDSQAMYLFLTRTVKVPASQILVVHADLGEVEWAGLKEHIRSTTDGHNLHVAVAVYADGSEKTLLGEWERKGKTPSPAQRWCTSDLKRGPIEKVVRAYMKKNGFSIAVNCMGLRAEESSSRSKMEPWKDNKRLSKAGRIAYDWLPIHDWKVGQVFGFIAECGQQPHEMYAKGMTRLSCCFCIMASKADLTLAATLNPTLYKRYVELEKKTGFTLQAGKTLEETTGIRVKSNWELENDAMIKNVMKNLK